MGESATHYDPDMNASWVDNDIRREQQCKQTVAGQTTSGCYSLVWTRWKAEGIHWDWQQQWWPYCPVVLENTDRAESGGLRHLFSVFRQFKGISGHSYPAETDLRKTHSVMCRCNRHMIVKHHQLHKLGQLFMLISALSCKNFTTHVEY